MNHIDTSTEAVERLLEGVTPGPWSEHDAGKHPYVFVCGPDQLYYDGEVTDKPLVAYVTGVGAVKNRAFIRAARDLVPALLKERDDLRAKLDEVQAEKEKLGREVNTARYGQPDFSWQLHKEALAEANARADRAEAALAAQIEAAKVAAACGLLDAYSAIVGPGNPWGDSLRAALAAIREGEA